MRPDPNPPTRVSVSSGDGQLSVLVAGPDGSDLPPVLAVHGFGSSAESTWVATGHVRALRSAGRFVIAPDLRGHGRSAAPHDPADYSLDGMVEDLRAVVASTSGADVIDVLGYSLGARLAAALAADVEASARGFAIRRLVLGGYDARLLFRGVDAEVLQEVLRRPDGLADADPDTRRIAEVALASPGNDLVALSALLVGMPPTDRVLALPSVPTLVAAGTTDPLAADAAALAASMPRGTFLPIAGRDHISALTSSAFRAAVVEFLAVGPQADRDSGQPAG